MSTPPRTEPEGLGDKPSPRPRADLSGAFGPPNRSGGLAGRLSRPARRTATPTDDVVPETGTPAPASTTVTETTPPAAPSAPDSGEEPSPATAAGSSTSQAEQSTTRAKKAPRGKTGRPQATRPRVAAEGGTVTSIVYLPGELLERLRRARVATGFTYTQLTLDALDNTHEVLPDLVAEATAPKARPAGSLFSGPSSAAATVQPKVQITLRPRSSDAVVIDKLATTHGISRSQLVSLALNAHLGSS